MKLYYGGFGDYMEFVVADSEEQAILKVGIKINAPFLPITVTEIAEVDGFTIRPVNSEDEKSSEVEAEMEAKVETDDTTSDETRVEVEEVEEDTEIKIFSAAEIVKPRHCKKCDFTCETQGQLLAHYRENHPKGD